MKHLKNKTILILLVFTMIFSMTGCSEVNDNKNQEQVKIEYTPIKITTKYPESLKTRDRIMKEIRESIKSQKVYRIKKDFTKNTEEPCPVNETESHDIWDKKIYVREKMYDSQNREVYQIEDREAYNKGGGSGARGTGGGIYRFCPEEEGVVYDDKGRVKSRIKMLDSEKKYRGIGDSGRKSVLRNEEKFGDWESRFSEYEYDEIGNLIKEEITSLDVNIDHYEKEIKEYVNGKVKKSTKVIDYEYPKGRDILIYVEITKEYDANEKLIKKFVLRKNKHNTMRSETNFDLIKGEIVTKYYDGDKAFATVTETLIGKDRAIVKRERVGDEFVIWDEYELKKIGDNLNNFYNRLIIVNNQNKYYYENYKDSINWKYNEGTKGITKDSYRKEHLLTQDINLDEGRSLSKEKEFYELEYNEKGNLYKVYQKRYKDNLKLEEELWDKDLANDMLDKTYKARIQKHLIEKEINQSEIEEKINNMKNRLW